MNSGKAPVCVPTWKGYVETTKDALMIFEACFNGTLAHCFRRPHDRERNHLIVSGNVFVYEEATSGIKRWTDGIPWSPSRILTNFLIYRQLNNPFPPGEKKRATKRGQRLARPGDPYPTSSSKDESFKFSPASPATPGLKLEESGEKDADRGLLGSLVDSYEFKDDGLVKKTMTVTINNVQHHLVSYYSINDAKGGLDTPRSDPRFKGIHLRDELLNQPKFKFPNFDDAGDGAMEQIETVPQQSYGYYSTGYDPTRQLSVTSQGHSTHQEPPAQAYFPAITQYVDQQQIPNGHDGYVTMPPTTSNYVALPPTHVPYQHQHQHQMQHSTQHQMHHPNQHQMHHSNQPQMHHVNQHQMQHSNQHPIQQMIYPQAHPQAPIPSPQSSHPLVHQIQPGYHQSSQFSPPNQPLHRPAHQIPYPEHQVQNLVPTLPRPNNSAYESGTDPFSQNHEFYSQNLPNAQSNESAVVLPQPWQAGLSPSSSFGNYRPSL